MPGPLSVPRHNKNTESSQSPCWAEAQGARIRQYVPASSVCPCKECVGNLLLIRSHKDQTVTCVHRQPLWRVYALLRVEGPLAEQMAARCPWSWCCGSLNRLRAGPRFCPPYS